MKVKIISIRLFFCLSVPISILFGCWLYFKQPVKQKAEILPNNTIEGNTITVSGGILSLVNGPCYVIKESSSAQILSRKKTKENFPDSILLETPPRMKVKDSSLIGMCNDQLKLLCTLILRQGIFEHNNPDEMTGENSLSVVTKSIQPEQDQPSLPSQGSMPNIKVPTGISMPIANDEFRKSNGPTEAQ